MEESKTIIDNVGKVIEVKAKDEPIDTSDVVVRLTPTGKISHAKTRVYTQRYRKEWEYMPDFQDWLTSVPNEATRAFCKFCQRNLHAHRLSLLKHMCTLKHQRAAVQYSNKSETETVGETFVIERVEEEYEEDDDVNYDETMCSQEEGEEMSLEDEVQDQMVEESESDTELPVLKKIRYQKEPNQDTLAQAMAHVEQEYEEENNEENIHHLQMVVDSDNDNDEDESNTYQIIKESDVQNEDTDKNHKLNSEVIKKIMNDSEENIRPITVSEFKNSSENQKKFYFFSTGGKSYTLVKSKLPQTVMNQLNDKNFTVVAKAVKNDMKNDKETNEVTTTITPSTSRDSSNMSPTVTNTSTIVKSTILKKPTISTHILETSKGIPVSGLQVSLYKLQDGRWTFIHESTTTTSGNCNDFCATNKTHLTTGRYKFHYDVEKYYSMKKTATIYPFIEIVFDIKDPNASYHIPLLLSPFSYSTYKDSNR